MSLVLRLGEREGEEMVFWFFFSFSSSYHLALALD